MRSGPRGRRATRRRGPTTSARPDGPRTDEWAGRSAGTEEGNPAIHDEKSPSLREAARRGVEAKQQAAPTTPAPAVEQAPRPAPFQKVKPPVVGTEQVAARCGHAVPFELFDPRRDKYRDDRRKKLTDRDCSACRIQAQAVREAAEKEGPR